MPRLIRFYGRIWHCAIKLPGGAWVRPVGHGYTPAEAYADWKAQHD